MAIVNSTTLESVALNDTAVDVLLLNIKVVIKY